MKKRGRTLLSETAALVLAGLIGIEAGTMVVNVLDHALTRTKMFLVDASFGEVAHEHGNG